MKRQLIISAICVFVGLIGGVILGRMSCPPPPPPSREQVMNYLKNLSMGEFTDFGKRMNAQLGFQAFPQQFVPSVSGQPGK